MGVEDTGATNIKVLYERVAHIDQKVSADYSRIEDKIDKLGDDIRGMWSKHDVDDKAMHEKINAELGALKLEFAVFKTKMTIIGTVASVVMSAVVSIVMKFLGDK